MGVWFRFLAANREILAAGEETVGRASTNQTTWLLLSLVLPLTSWSQVPAANGKRLAFATFTTEKITLDARLTEPAWQTAVPVGDFTQREPDEGEPATERTEVRILYDKENLYIGAYLHDRTPEKIVIDDIRRDASNTEQDFFAVLLDTFDDDRNGYYFSTTLVGSYRDLQFSDGGRVSNVAWDGVWQGEVQQVEDGHTMEVAIPFKTLRFSREAVQTWGLQFSRRIRRNNETDLWAPAPRRFTAVSAVAYAGELRGIENVEPGRNVQIKPYALGGVERLQSRGEEVKGDYDGGLDLKYAVTPSVVLDLTANTDFSHVEADNQQVNLTRFSTFFQEKREFFLENSGVYRFGDLSNNEALLFHSRTIGLEGGQPIPILGGVRLTGRAGRNDLGLLNMQTRSQDSSPATNFTVARIRRNLWSDSDLGAMFLNRQSRLQDDHNRSFGLDGNLVFYRRTLRFSSTFAKTSTPGRSGDDRLAKITAEFENSVFRYQSSYLDLGKNFNPEMGFARAVDRAIVNNQTRLTFLVRDQPVIGAALQEIFLSGNSEHVLPGRGGTESKVLRPQLQFVFRDASSFDIQYAQNFERIEKEFELPSDVVVPPGDYKFNRTNLLYSSDRSKMFSFLAAVRWGGFWSGTRFEKEFNFRFRPSYKFSTSVNYERNDAKLPEGSFTTHLISGRVDLAFNPRMYLNTLVQYNNDDNQFSTNIRFRLIHRPLSDMYVVYNDLRDHRRKTNDRRLTLKYTHLMTF
ncbi:MAG: carbohydrate binding family 9 domain-containing protein [Acidobacteria bacterium]|nr:carbohydrate binding family 9 domain-containing protein [Acidobacteriota bacterium]